MIMASLLQQDHWSNTSHSKNPSQPSDWERALYFKFVQSASTAYSFSVDTKDQFVDAMTLSGTKGHLE